MAAEYKASKLKIEADDGGFDLLLENVDETDTLAKIRSSVEHQLSNKKLRGVSFFFLTRGVPISSAQEQKIMWPRVIPNHKDECNNESENPVKRILVKCLPIQDDKHHVSNFTVGDQAASKTQSQTQSHVKITSSYQVYSKAELELSSGIDLKKRLFWNLRILDFEEDLKFKRRSKHEDYGIIDLEWTLRKTELLKVQADKTIFSLRKTEYEDLSVSRTSTSKDKTVIANYEKLNRADFDFRWGYQKMEQVVNKLIKEKGESSPHVERLRQKEEDEMDKRLTHLKQAQSNLQKALEVMDDLLNEEKAEKGEGESGPSDVTVPDLKEEEYQEIAESVKADYDIENL